MIEVYSVDIDKVINGQFITAKTSYRYAINNIVPLIDKLDIQRKIQDSKFYRRLEKDLLKGCIMPPLTLAFISDISNFRSSEESEKFIMKNIQEAFVLDGIQRLNTLQRINNNPNLDLDRPLFLNILFCNSRDNLLYRMITLNNGQKPMTARHQIEILASNVYDFNNLPIEIQSEKERTKRRIKGSFRKADIIKSYIAFLADSTNLDDQRIIEEKMDELIAEKILDSNITEDNLEFSDVINLIDILSEDSISLNWFKVNNNLIGFSVGIKHSYDLIKNTPNNRFRESVQTFDKAFTGFNISKVKLGQQRRKLVSIFIQNYKKLSKLDSNDLLYELIQLD